MFTLLTAFRNVIRHKRRGIISCLLLFVCLSVIVGALFCENYYDKYIAEVTEEYSAKVKIQFRQDLQFYGRSSDMNWVLKTIQMDGSGFTYYDGTTPEEQNAELARMEQYNHPYPFTREMFEGLSAYPAVEGSSLVYTASACRFDGDTEKYAELMEAYSAGAGVGDSNEGENQTMNTSGYAGVCQEFSVIGGDMTEYCEFISEEKMKFRWKWGLLEGTEPGPGECVITKYAADEFGRKVGDLFELYNEDGEQIAALKISGIMQMYASEQMHSNKVSLIVNRPAGLDFQLFGFDIIPGYGTPYGREVISDAVREKIKAENPGYAVSSASLLYLVHTDFDTAYYLYGNEKTDPFFEERHQFNNYMASYRLKSGENTAGFTAYIRKNMGSGYDDEFEAGAYLRTIAKNIDIPNHVYHSFGTLIRYGTGFFLFILLIVVLVNIRERGYEIGILYASGIRSGQILLQFAAENGMIAGAAALLSSFGGVIGVKAGELNYFFLSEENLDYTTPFEWVYVVLLSAAAAFLLSAVITSVYLLVKNPAKILRER